ncbi:hypothetical protein [Clostridium sp. HMP27]|uniref:hypothetical protein n=1 Tax=Clostridium sp. HMP27 TaxID=1487921 RepID=UPI00052E310F|nr:hypothetical protein [Clostridium sp. HMP27]KGK88025.1 hypothetical protein DP68_08825 [Clostridium sp. HMP27]
MYIQLSLLPKLFNKGDIVRFCNRDHRVRKIIEPGDGDIYYEFVDIKHGGTYILGNRTIEKGINEYIKI